MSKTTIAYLLTGALLTALLTACSGDKPNANSTTQAPAPKPSVEQTSTAPAVTSDTSTTTNPASSAESDNSSDLPSGGKVIRALHAGGYTYMQLEDDEGRQFWVATDMMNVKREDHISWASAALQKDFNSSSLHRHFDEILFVTSARNEH